MDPSVYKVIKKVHDLMTGPRGEVKDLTELERAYIVGQLEAILEVFMMEQPPEEHGHKLMDAIKRQAKNILP